jgi:hypothetical protein
VDSPPGTYEDLDGRDCPRCKQIAAEREAAPVSLYRATLRRPASLATGRRAVFMMFMSVETRRRRRYPIRQDHSGRVRTGRCRSAPAGLSCRFRAASVPFQPPMTQCTQELKPDAYSLIYVHYCMTLDLVTRGSNRGGECGHVVVGADRAGRLVPGFSRDRTVDRSGSQAFLPDHGIPGSAGRDDFRGARVARG